MQPALPDRPGELGRQPPGDAPCITERDLAAPAEQQAQAFLLHGGMETADHMHRVCSQCGHKVKRGQYHLAWAFDGAGNGNGWHSLVT